MVTKSSTITPPGASSAEGGQAASPTETPLSGTGSIPVPATGQKTGASLPRPLQYVIARCEPGSLSGVIFWDGCSWSRRLSDALVYADAELARKHGAVISGEPLEYNLARVAGVR